MQELEELEEKEEEEEELEEEEKGGRRRMRYESPDRSVRTPTRNLFARHSPASSEEIRFPIIFTLTSSSSGSDLVLFLYLSNHGLSGVKVRFLLI